jgi:tetratricopeptide (TPR) repeat protein
MNLSIVGNISDETSFKYDAFISYSHAADGRLAPSLHHALERFAKSWYQRRKLRIFHDTTGLGVTEALWPEIQAAIESSRFFILLASPHAASSKWVQREVATRISHGGNILIVLTEGNIVWDEDSNDFDWQLTDALPNNLSGHYDYEPLYSDLRSARDRDSLSLKHPTFLDTVAALSSAIHGVDKDELSSEAVSKHRNAMRLAWGTVALLVLLLIGAIYQTMNANQSRNLAEARLRDALRVARHIVFKIDRDLESVAGGSAVRKDLLQSSAELLAKLQGNAQDSPDVLRARLATHHERGDLALTNDDLDLAQQEFESAYHIAQELVRRDRSNFIFWQDAMHAVQRLSVVARIQGRYTDARKLLDQALDVGKYLQDQKPRHSPIRSDLALVYSGYCDLEKALGHLDLAEDQCRRALEIEQRLVAEYPDDTLHELGSSKSLNKLGDLLLEAGRPGQAEPYYRQALEIRQRLYQEEPQNAIYRLDLAASFSRLGRAKLDLQQLDDAQNALEQAAGHLETLSRADSKHLQAIGNLAVVKDRLGLLHQARGDTDAARSQYKEYLALAEELTKRDPSSLNYATTKVYALLHIGDFEWELKNTEAANGYYTSALEMTEALRGQYPDRSDLTEILALCHDKSGNVAFAAGDPVTARMHYDQALKLFQKLRRQNEQNQQYIVYECQAHRRFGWVAAGAKDWDQARRHFEDALALARTITKEDSSPQIQLNLCSLLLDICAVELEAGSAMEARKFCDESVAITSALLKTSPGGTQITRVHGEGLALIGALNEKLAETKTPQVQE